MKTKAMLLLIFIGTLSSAGAQSYKLDNTSSSLEVLGTSTLHDWEITAEELNGTAQLSSKDDVYSINSLNFQVKVESLKSGKSSMDNNTYEALNSDDYPTIDYKLNEVVSVSNNGNKYDLKTKGALTIAGTTKVITIPVKAEINENNMVCTGEVTFKMTDFNVDPPTALLGTVKTGDQITIKFKTEFKN
ncbi:YceI family protein [Fulvivirga lutea]|uniref:YceI family protein n=1 Tax=Fulvivirga lutea TaxID=2810512 RepID=A0A974ZZK0_9BACT|nr:YceI family protein [Fulvivirga lutea]QSE96309.1 YceI family protein [Fulvivirga lutea]